MLAAEIAFWAGALMLVHTHLIYPLSLTALARFRPGDAGRWPSVADADLPPITLVIAAHDEADVIAARVANALAADYPRELLQVIVASDGSADRTAELAREAGADLVLELDRAGKVEAQNRAVERSTGRILAFSDANSMWEPGALRRLAEVLDDPAVGYVCGGLTFTNADGATEEGAYWRYEMAVRSLESRLGSITAGNGAIYACRRDDYVVMPSSRGHDLCLPFAMVRRGLRAVYEPAAAAGERTAPSMEGEFARKRRMMNRTWGVLLEDSMLSPRGYPPVYWYEQISHRGLRYISPFLHLVVFAATVILVADGAGWVYTAALVAQLLLLAAAALSVVVSWRPLSIAGYYVMVTASSAVGLWDRIRNGPIETWTPVEGTR